MEEGKGSATSQRKGRSGTWCDAFTQGAVTLSNRKQQLKREAAIEAIKKICELAENKDAD